MQHRGRSRLVGAVLTVGLAVGASSAGAQPLLDPATIPKYGWPLVVPPAMPMAGTLGAGEGAIDYYEIAVRQFTQQVLPPPFPATTVWGYGSILQPETFHYPAFTIEARVGRPVRVKWINDLVDENGDPLPHLLPVDPTLTWANPPGGVAGRDSRPTFPVTPGPYRGPVPIVTHLHGGLSAQESDGFPEAWFLPRTPRLPAGYAAEGTWYDAFRREFRRKYGVDWEPGTATFQYENDQPAATLWYHDHVLGMTRANVYAGPAGFYLLRGCAGRDGGDAEDGDHHEGREDHDREDGDRHDRRDGHDRRARGGEHHHEHRRRCEVERLLPGAAARGKAGPYEIPLAIQDRSFRADGSLFYPDSRTFFDGFAGPFIPGSDVPPIWNPEFFGNSIVVNGRTWPSLDVEPRRYRFRILNGSNSRFLILKLVADPLAARPATPALPFWQIGAEAGFLPSPVRRERLLLGPAERADVIVELGDLRPGTKLYLVNEGPDEPFGGGEPVTDFAPADPGTTGQVMRLAVVPLRGEDRSVPAAKLELPRPERPGKASRVRKVSLNEAASTFPGFDGPVEALLGVVTGAGAPIALGFDDPITEVPRPGETELWEIHNFTADAHPIHLHATHFQVVSREPFALGPRRPPEPGESGMKDTVVALPGEITRVRARFDIPGLFVWHCHILEHEDNEMMRPLFVGRDPPDLDAPPGDGPSACRD